MALSDKKEATQLIVEQEQINIFAFFIICKSSIIVLDSIVIL